MSGIEGDAQKFLQFLNQAVKLVPLYGLEHPACAGASKEAGKALERLLLCAGADRATLTYQEGQWIVNGMRELDPAHVPGEIGGRFAACRILTLSASSGLLASELSVLCALLCTSPPTGDPEGYLRNDGGVHNLEIVAL